MFKKNDSKEDIEKEREGPIRDVGLATSFEEREKDSSVPLEEGYGGYERGEELLDEMDTLHAFRQLRDKLDEFEKAREELKVQIEATENLLPNLKKDKEHLEKSVHEKRDKMAEIAKLLPNLERKKEDMQKDIARKQQERDRLEKEIRQGQEKIMELDNLVPNLKRNRAKFQKSMQRDQREISRIDEEINLISYAQRYRTKLFKLR